jgi:RimJ/RimL family protein N-acetyltransferase
LEWSEFPGHHIVLETPRLVLRPFRETDFVVALPFYADAEFRRAMDNNPASASLDYLRTAGLYLAERGWLFAVELKDGQRPVGEACLERMNLERAAVRPGERVFRVPIGIWDKTLWGRGLGGEILDRLLEFGFVEHGADRICAMSVGSGNRRSLEMFKSRGFRVVRDVPDEGTVDLELGRNAYSHRHRDRAI